MLGQVHEGINIWLVPVPWVVLGKEGPERPSSNANQPSRHLSTMRAR